MAISLKKAYFDLLINGILSLRLGSDHSTYRKYVAMAPTPIIKRATGAAT